MDDEIILLETKTDQDDIGNTIITETIEHPVICKVQSVDRQEFFKAGQVGMNPKYRFDTDKVNYNGEELVKYKDKVYATPFPCRGPVSAMESIVPMSVQIPIRSSFMPKRKQW